MGFIGLEISGTEELRRDFKRYGVKADKAVSKAVSDTAKNVETDAKNRLRGMFGSDKHIISNRLRSSVYNRIYKGDKDRKVGSDVDYAPYIEFGTGEKVFTSMSFSAEARQVAAQFRGTKQVKGIKGDSFLNWAAVNQVPKFRKRLIDNLNKIR